MFESIKEKRYCLKGQADSLIQNSQKLSLQKYFHV